MSRIHRAVKITDRPMLIEDRTIPVVAILRREVDLRPRIPMINPMIPVTIAMNPKKHGMIDMTAKTVPMIPSTRLVTACPAPGSGGVATT